MTIISCKIELTNNINNIDIIIFHIKSLILTSSFKYLDVTILP